MADIPPILHIPIGEVVKRWRDFHGLTLTEFAKRAGVSKGYVSEVERNVISDPKPPQLAKLASALGIEVWDLMRRRMPSESDQAQQSAELVGGKKRRSSGALASPPVKDRLGTTTSPTLGQTVDLIVSDEDLSREEQGMIGEVVVALTRQLARTIKQGRKGLPSNGREKEAEE